MINRFLFLFCFVFPQNDSLGFTSLLKVIFTDFKVVNVLAVCNMPFEIRLPEFTKNNRPHARYVSEESEVSQV